MLEEFCVARGLANVEFVEEIGGDLNLKRAKFIALMDRVEAEQVWHLIIAHQDRLVRFGFSWFERFCSEHHTELLVLNQEQLSPEQEMVQDLLTIVHCFSARLYGLRNYRKKLNTGDGREMILGHTIALDPTPEQEAYFRRACGTARFAYNWARAEWNRRRAAGEKPSTAVIKARWNAYRDAELPWTCEVTKWASGQAILDLGTAFANFFRDCDKPKKRLRFLYPQFKKKQLNEGLALCNDQFDLDWDRIRIPKLGWVRIREHLRLCGVILGATVSFSGGRWCVSIQVDADGHKEAAPPDSIVGVDLGVETLATFSTGDKIEGPKPGKRLLGRIQRLQRRIRLQKHRAKKARNKTSRRQFIRQLRLSKLQARVANIRKDATHKLTTDLTRRFETIVIEDLNVSGMSKNHALAGAVLDRGFREIRRQLQYKAAMRGGNIVVADRFFPSSKTCSVCGCIKDSMPLSIRTWICDDCGAEHDRDINAAINLERLGLAEAEVTRGDMGPLLVHASVLASAAVEPRT